MKRLKVVLLLSEWDAKSPASYLAMKISMIQLAATSDLFAFLFSMIAPVKISVNHLRTVVSIHALNSMAPVPH